MMNKDIQSENPLPSVNLNEKIKKRFLLLSFLLLIVLILCVACGETFGNINDIALTAYVLFMGMLFFFDVDFLASFFWLIIMNSLNLAGIYVIEKFSITLVELQEKTYFVGAFSVMAIAQVLMYMAAEWGRLKNETNFKKASEHNSRKDVSMYNRKMAIFITFIGSGILLFLWGSVITKPYFFVGMDRLTYASKIVGNFRRSLSSYLPLLIPTAVMCFVLGKKKTSTVFFALLLIYYFWVGNKFGVYFITVYITVSCLYVYIERKRIKKIVTIVVLVFAGLLGIVLLQRVLLYGETLNQIWEYLYQRLAQQGEVWWSIFRQKSPFDFSNLHEIKDEFTAIFSEGKGSELYAYGQWKMMIKASWKNVAYAQYRIDVGNPYTSTTAASLYYYFGILGPILFYPLFGYVYSFVMTKLREHFINHRILGTIVTVKVILMLHDLIGASEIKYLLSKGLVYIIAFIILNKTTLKIGRRIKI